MPSFSNPTRFSVFSMVKIILLSRGLAPQTTRAGRAQPAATFWEMNDKAAGQNKRPARLRCRAEGMIPTGFLSDRRQTRRRKEQTQQVLFQKEDRKSRPKRLCGSYGGVRRELQGR